MTDHPDLPSTVRSALGAAWKVVALLLFLAVTSRAQAGGQQPSVQQPSGEQNRKNVSVTLSLVPLFDGIAQVHVEFRTSVDFAAAAILGAGLVLQDAAVSGTKPRTPIYIAGLQSDYYIQGTFQNGTQFGTTALLVWNDLQAEHGYYDSGTNLYLVLHLGYKLVYAGLTANMQIGAGFHYQKHFVTQAIGAYGTRYGYTEPSVNLGAILHLNVGYSF